MAAAPDDHMIMHGDAKLQSGINDFPRHVDIGDGRGGIAGRVVMG
jgi:hypothetical protein